MKRYVIVTPSGFLVPGQGSDEPKLIADYVKIRGVPWLTLFGQGYRVRELPQRKRLLPDVPFDLGEGK